MTVDLKALQRELNKEYDGALLFGDDPGLDPVFIPTGLPQLDAILDGGIQKGQISLVIGKFSSGKSTLAAWACGKAQQAGGTAAWIDGERAFNKVWAARLGVRLGELLYTAPETAEQAFDIARSLIDAGVDIVVIDSLVALVPAARVNAERGMDQKFMGQKAQLINEGLGLLASRLTKKTTAVIAINQLRQQVGVVYGNPEFIPGGKGQEFIAYQLIRVQRKGWIDAGEGKDKKHVGFVMGFKVEKSKAGEPFKVAEVPFRFTGEEIFDTEAILYDQAIELGVIVKRGSVYSVPSIVPDRKMIGIKKVQEYMDENPDAFEELRRAVQEAQEAARGEVSVE